ncbi:MAG: restriction endonuclease subunit S [Peptostreptococcaceae bacterium]|nr:restriction endonuclease subunit S [Peptostreptococcaceae bacterium]
MTNVPKLRFAEFSKEWEAKTVENIFSRINKTVNVNPNENYRQIGIRSHGKGIFYKKEVTGREIGKKRVFWVEPYVFIVNIVFAWEQAVASTTVNELGMIASHRFPMYKPKKDLLDLDFITYYFKTKKGKSLLELASPGGAGRNRTLGQKEFSELKIKLPCKDEQIKIAEFLSAVDCKIKNQKKVIVSYELLKKGYMQKIFSQDLRFQDENGQDFADWQDYRMKDIGFFKTSSVDKLFVENQETVKLVNYMDVYNHLEINGNTLSKLMSVSAKDGQIKENNLLAGDILFTPSSETSDDIGHSIVIFENLPNTLYSYHLVRFRPNEGVLNINFSHYFCNYEGILNQFSKFSQGATRHTLSLSAFGEIDITIPKSLNEQNKIAAFFAVFDQKIEVENLILGKWQNIKNGLLQQLFA